MSIEMHDTVNPWDGLVAAALLGAARRPVDPASLPGAVGEIGARLPETDPSARLLDAAALMTAARRASLAAGTMTAAGPEADTGRQTLALIAPVDTTPLVSRAAAARLDDLLAGTRSDADALLVQWLRTAAQQGRRAPADRLPALLDWARRRRSHADVLPVLGERGRWLAQHHGQWRRTLENDVSSTPTASDQVWTHGTPHERQSWFDARRRDDPAAARDLLLALTWNRQDGDSRLAFVAALSWGLSLADEEILDRALGDRRKDVRTLAADLLGQIPGGRFQEQAAARALACVRVEHPARPSLVARRPSPYIVVTLPDDSDSAPWPAGLIDVPHGTGTRSWLLRNLVAATPLDRWTRLTGLTPDTLVALPVADDLASALHDGWARAAVRESDVVWARLLVPAVSGSLYTDLVRILPLAERSDLFVTMLGADLVKRPARHHNAIYSALATMAVTGPWSVPVTDAVLSWLAQSLAPEWEVSALVDQAATALPSDIDTEVRLRAAATALTPTHPRHGTILSLADTLLYRRQMIEELQ